MTTSDTPREVIFFTPHILLLPCSCAHTMRTEKVITEIAMRRVGFLLKHSAPFCHLVSRSMSSAQAQTKLENPSSYKRVA